MNTTLSFLSNNKNKKSIERRKKGAMKLKCIEQRIYFFKVLSNLIKISN